MNKIFFYIMIIGGLFYSCVSQPVLYKLKGDQGGLYDKNLYVYADGYSLVFSNINEIIVGIVGYEIAVDEVLFVVNIINRSNSNITIIPDALKVYGENDNQTEWNQLYVYTENEYSKKLDEQFKRQKGLMFFVAGMAAYNASTSTTTSNSYTSGSISDDSGNRYSGSALTSTTSKTYDPSKSTEIYNNVYANEDRLRTQYQDQKTFQLKKHTLFPNDEKAGGVIVKKDVDAISRYLIEVPIGNDVHRFWFKVDFESNS